MLYRFARAHPAILTLAMPPIPSMVEWSEVNRITTQTAKSRVLCRRIDDEQQSPQPVTYTLST
jgi:hypothetical protein